MNVKTNHVRSYDSLDGIRYAQEVGVLNGEFVSVPVIFGENGNTDYQFPVMLAEFIIHSYTTWKMN